jgi:hypothetical protein
MASIAVGIQRFDAAWWETIASIATAVGVLLALVGLVVTLWLTLRSEKLTRRGLHQELELAESSAARSEAAAALTEEYTRRVVLALERLAEQPSISVAGAPPALPARVEWTLGHRQGDSYLLENSGEKAALAVRVSAHETMIFREPEEQDVLPHHALTFIAARSMATKDSTITVTWREEGQADEQTWRYPLPPRPPRSK